jgi:hypothetical protein
MTYRQLVDSHNAFDLAEELAFERLEPAPDLNKLFARLTAIVWNAWFSPKRSEEDFMPPKPFIERRENPEKIHAIFSAIAAARA